MRLIIYAKEEGICLKQILHSDAGKAINIISISLDLITIAPIMYFLNQITKKIIPI